MAKLITIPKGTTIFKGYDKPRLSKAKRYVGLDYTYEICKPICSICHFSLGEHYGGMNQLLCPEHQKIEF